MAGTRRSAWRAMVALTAAVLAGCSAGSDRSGGAEDPAGTASVTPIPGEADGELVLGLLLPRRGTFSPLTPAQTAAVQVAVGDINAAGGVLGNPVRVVTADAGVETTPTAWLAVGQLFAERVDAIIGPTSSSTSLSVLDRITGSGVLQISPTATAAQLTAADDRGLFFRTVATDASQARALGTEISLEENPRLGILAVDDPYGVAMAEQVADAYEVSGGDVVSTISYDPEAESFAAEVAQVKAAGAGAVAVLGFDETTRIVQELTAQGIGPPERRIYVAAGGLSRTPAVPPGTLTGVKGVLPGARADAGFAARLKQQNPSLTDVSYGAEAYDAVTTVALAAAQAGSDAGRAMAEQIAAVSKDGQRCTSFATCSTLISQRKDIDYDGPSGPIAFDDEGDAAAAFVGIYQYTADGTLAFVRPGGSGAG